MFNSAATPTCRTSARSAHPSAIWISTSTTSTRPFPGPWEWDVKRLAASVEVMGRDRGFAVSDRRDMVTACVREYRLRNTAGSRAGNARCLVRPHRHRRGPGVGPRRSRREAPGQARRQTAKEGCVAKARHATACASSRNEPTMIDGKLQIVADPPADRADRRSGPGSHDERRRGGDGRARPGREEDTSYRSPITTTRSRSSSTSTPRARW